MSTVVNVISYNMSVFSAIKSMGGIVPGYASEARFLSRPSSENFFNNAVGHLLTNLNNAAFIGIQEYHPPTLDKIKGDINNANYEYVSFEKQITNNAKVLTIFDKSVFGDMLDKYQADLGLTVRGDGTNIFNPPAASGVPPNDGGRPILIVLTRNGYTLINFHGPNRPRLTAQPVDVGNLLKKALPIHVDMANTQFGGKIDFNKIIITCDSNDRGHIINMESPLVLGGVSYHDGNPAASGALSCCYNYDSCGIDAIPAGPPASMGSAGAESNYIYTGDYVLANHFSEAVNAKPSPLDAEGASVASDHKLVVASVVLDTSEPMNVNTGGARRRRRCRGRRTYKKSRKSRGRGKGKCKGKSRRYKK